MYCSKCGKQNENSNKFCVGCGNKFELIQTNVNPQLTNIDNNQLSTSLNDNVQNINNSVNNFLEASTNNTNNINQIQHIEENKLKPTNPNVGQPQNMGTVNMAGFNNPNAQQTPNMGSVNISNYNNQNIQQAPNMGTVNMSGFNNNISQPISNTKNKKSFKKPIIILTVIILAIILIGGLDLGSNKENKLEQSTPTTELSKEAGTRTIMIYMIGSNLESEYGAASSDIEEIIDSKYNTNDLNIIIYTAGSKKWKNSKINANENGVYKVTSKGLEKITAFPKKSAAKKESLTEFIDYVYDNYKSDLYDLILWDHGGGPNIGYGQDELYNQLLSVSDLNSALDSTKLLKDTKFEIIGFDACLMGSAEIANVLKEEANYLIASEEIEPGLGWNYNFLSKINKNTSSIDFGKKVIDEYYQLYMDLNDEIVSGGYNYNQFEVTLALIDLGKIDALVSAIDNSFKNVSTNLNTDAYTIISKNSEKATQYGKIDDTSSYDLVDLYDLVSKNSSQLDKTSELSNAIKNAVIYQKNNIKGSNGISIYFPIVSKKNFKKYSTIYQGLNFSSNYTSFLNNYNGIALGKRFVTSDSRSIKPIVNDNNNLISATIPDDLANNYLKSDYIIFKENEYGGYFAVYKGKNISLNGNTISTTPIQKELVITDKNGEEDNFVVSFEYDRDETSVTYQVLVELENVDLTDFRLDLVYLLVKFENGSNEGQIIDILPFANSDEVYNKVTFDLSKYTHIVSMSSSYTIEDENGVMLDEFINGDIIYGAEYKLSDNDYKFVLRDFDEKNYYYVFRIKDTQGNIHILPKVQLNK